MNMMLERHPLSCGYTDISGAAWEDFKANVKARGAKARKITLYQGKILDGWQLYRACRDLGVEASFADLPDGEDPEAFVETANDFRRHESAAMQAERRQKRVARVSAARATGQSTRTIAEAEGVSQPQVLRDLAQSGDTGVSPEPSSGQVVGKDKKKYKPYLTPILCKRCQTVAPNVGVKDCKACADAREQAAKAKKKRKPKKPAPRADVKDQLGAVVPDSCRDAFADPSLAEIVAEMEIAEGCLTPKTWTERAGKLCAHYPFILIEKLKEHAYEALHQLQCALSAIKAGLPHAVCPKCQGVDSTANGKTCRTCRGCGHIPVHRWKEWQSDHANAV